jgi:hypothetical protein
MTKREGREANPRRVWFPARRSVVRAILAGLIVVGGVFQIGLIFDTKCQMFDRKPPRAYRVGECLGFNSLTHDRGMSRVGCTDRRAFYQIAVIRDLSSAYGCPRGQYAPLKYVRFQQLMCTMLVVPVGK